MLHRLVQWLLRIVADGFCFVVDFDVQGDGLTRLRYSAESVGMDQEWKVCGDVGGTDVAEKGNSHAI